MNRLLGRLVAAFILVLIGGYGWTHWHSAAEAVATPNIPVAAPEPTYAEAREAHQAVGVSGPLADFMLHRKPADVETLKPIAYTPSAADHVSDDSPVGTSRAILRQTFGVASIVNLPFEVPAHAANPQLRGTYRSFLKQAGSKQGATDASEADVEFLVLTEQQYGELLNGQASEAVFSADDSHDQEVNASLPPTRDQAAKYFLVFRNGRHEAGKHEVGKTFVQADFRIDF
jgi:hypothetical protein